MKYSFVNKLPQATGSSLLVSRSQSIEDILSLVKKGVKDSYFQAKRISSFFERENKIDSCYAIWKFLKTNVEYQRESKELQTVKTLSRLLLMDRKGDCKHFSTAVATLLTSLNIPFFFRLVSFNHFDKSPTHIYIVANINGKKIPIDCCLKKFNTEPPYKYKTDYYA